MFSRNSVLLSVAIVIGCLLMAIVPQLFGQGEQPPALGGRYHATAAGSSGAVFVCDTSTGECWYGGIGVRWRSVGVPNGERSGEEATLIIPRR